MDLANLKTERENRGMTREELAVAVGVTMASVFRWESGKNKPLRAFKRRLDKIFREKKNA